MKNFLIFLLFLILGTMAFVIIYKLKSSAVKPSINFPKSDFSLQNPPTESLRGNITSLSGSVSFQGRGTDYATPISNPQQILQGDEVSTLGDGMASINFEKVGKISMLSKTHLNIVQTLPQNVVIEETEGDSGFEREGNIPFTIRGLDLAINLNDKASIDIQVDKDNSEVDITIKSGEINFYYTDTSNNTNVIPAKAGKKIIFNNNTKTFKVVYL